MIYINLNRGRERLSPSPPSEPGVRFSRDGLSSQLFHIGIGAPIDGLQTA